MKIEWQEADITGGRIIAKPGRTERWMIGYFAEPDQYALVSTADGMICQTMTAAQMAECLNRSGDMPAEFVDNWSDRAKARQKGGHARAAALSPERRSEIASDAAQARWSAQTSGK